MNLRQLFSRKPINYISKLSIRASSPYSCHRFTSIANAVSYTSPSYHSKETSHSFRAHSPKYPRPSSHFDGCIRTATTQARLDEGLEPEPEDAKATMNDFLSRFVWIMRKKISEAYPDCDKKTIDGMLLIIVEKVVAEMEKGSIEHMTEGVVASEDFSEDLWRTVWEVSSMVLEDMEKERKKEKMKVFLQSEEVKEMVRFAGEVGVRGDLLRELRFKWAREKMEESEFYKSLKQLREEEAQSRNEPKMELIGEGKGGLDDEEDKSKAISLPKRHGKINYKIYGLDLSDPKWAEVAGKIHKSEEMIWPQEPKPISGKCKHVTEEILSLQEEEDPLPLLTRWIDLLQPSRIDWITLLDKLKERNERLYLKVAEHVLAEDSFQTNIRDYSKLVDAHARENRLEDAERILRKMIERGVVPDILTLTIMVHMYSKSGNLDRAKEAYNNLRSQGFRPDMKVYNSMIMAHVKAGHPKMGESLMREMEARDIKPTMEIYMALLRSFSQLGDVNGAQRIATTMQFAGFQPNLETCTLLVEAFGHAGDADQARNNFDYMMKLGLKPDDRCMASMITAYEKKNYLDRALNLLLELENDGIEPGIATYTVLVDWLGKLQLIDEAEQILDKISEQGEAPPFRVHVSLCDMYARAGVEKKALQALGVLEAKKELLGAEDFERVMASLIEGGFVQDALRMQGVMEAQGIQAAEPLRLRLLASQAVGRNRKTVC